ncbi:MAG: hypothetical protein ACP5N1_04665 [Candidatus Woesearchaeota archaeon]
MMDLIDFKKIIGIIEESNEFQDFIKKNSDYYLVHVFTIDDSETSNIWQIGYYSKTTDKIVVFEYNNDMVLIHPEADALKKDEYIQPLDLAKLTVSKEGAVNIYNLALREFYPKELPSKTIILLQNLPEYSFVWNITIVTLTLSVINIKINASTGDVIKHTKENMMSWRA